MIAMSIVDDDDYDSWPSAASPAGTSSANNSTTTTTVETVSKMVSDRLLHKYMDLMDDAEDSVCVISSSSSQLWSPAVSRRVFLDSCTGNICTGHDMLSKLRSLKVKSTRCRTY